MEWKKRKQNIIFHMRERDENLQLELFIHSIYHELFLIEYSVCIYAHARASSHFFFYFYVTQRAQPRSTARTRDNN